MIKQFRWALLLSVIALAVALVFGGPTTLAVVLILSLLEISLSFDNAVVNAKVLQRMHPTWQKLFLTVGVLIAVFGMRLVFPLLIVSLTASLSPSQVIDLALNNPKQYGAELADARHAIFSFGGTFLFMIFLDFIFDGDRDVRWLRRTEALLQRFGRVDALSVIVALASLLGVAAAVGSTERSTVLVAGGLGLLIYLLVSGLDGLFEESEEAREQAQEGVPVVPGAGAFTGAAFKTGLFAFLYLEVLDASFSFDGVIGAFAVSDEVLVIALGLGVGAFWIRSLTLYLVRAGTLAEYPFLEHGAHYAIGALAVVSLSEVLGAEVPEVVTGLLGVGFIALALYSSIKRRDEDGDGDETQTLDEAEAAITLPAGRR